MKIKNKCENSMDKYKLTKKMVKVGGEKLK
jgi:hypothetical protein